MITVKHTLKFMNQRPTQFVNTNLIADNYTLN